MKLGVLPWSLAVSLLCGVVSGADTKVGFIEKFALAPDREAVLTQLVPGTEEYFFYHALHFQNTGQRARLDEILKQWAGRFKDSPQRRIIENRAALLTYDADPQATLKFLRERLELQFHHEREALDQPPNLPTALDAAHINLERYEQIALGIEELNSVSVDVLESMVRRKVKFSDAQRRNVLKRFERPDVEGLLDLILAELRRPQSPAFGEFTIHHALLPEQMDALAKALPALRESQAFVHTRLKKLHPGADVDLEEDVQERAAWLDRLWEYARTLSPQFNPLKGFILYRRLDHDRQQGVYDRARFTEYLKLPRRFPYVNPRYLDRAELRQYSAELREPESAAVVGIAPLPTDEPLVREYLLELLKNDATPDSFAPFIRDTYLREIFAESKIVNGIGNPNQWTAFISPGRLQALKERVDLEFAANSPRYVLPDAEVKLQVAVKNVPNLLVRIYEINTLAYFQNQKQQLNTDLNVDGLVANVERTQELADEAGRNPFRRVPRVFEFPELKGKRGAWIIEFIGGGKSSRALVRKGQYHVLQRQSGAGDVLTVIDESRNPVKDAVVWLEGHRYAPDAQTGIITVPYTNQPGEKPVILADASGEFATLASFTHHAEKYQVDAQFHLEREQLLARREATVAIRASLLVGDQRVALELLEEPTLEITATTLDGIDTVSRVEGVKFEPNAGYLHKFQVPERLAHLHVTLKGKVERLTAGGEKQELSASEEWALNGIDRSDEVVDGHLSKLSDRYVFQLLGKNAEPKRDRAIVFELHRHGFNDGIEVELRTDERGRVDLGPLAGIRRLQARVSDAVTRDWEITDGDGSQSPLIHAAAGDIVRVAWPDAQPLTRAVVSLLEKRAATFALDRFSAVSLVDGVLELKGLPAGEYSLILRGKEREEITIRIGAGAPVQNWIAGPSRFLEVRNPAPVQIAAVDIDPQSVVVRLKNANPLTRVHIAATRFVPDESSLPSLGHFRIVPPSMLEPAHRPNLYTSGRRIGDEYRYILERRYAQIFAGSMLARPGLLLNPWELRTTDLQMHAMAGGEAPKRSSGDRDARGVSRQMDEAAKEFKQAVAEAGDDSANLDFLATVAPVIYNLVPDAQGSVRLDRKALGDRQHVQVYAADPFSAQWRFLALPEQQTATRDLRLTRNLDPEKAFVESREVTPLKQGEKLTLPDLLGSDVAIYDSLASVHGLLSSLTKDEPSKAKLAKFSFVLRWPKLPIEEKRAKYSEFACHELNFFLARKDPEFFKAVVLPFLRNKKDKTFLDEYLIEADLSRYLQPWYNERLNVVEKALLGKRPPADLALVARHLREFWEMLPRDPARQDNLFEAALRGRGLTEAEVDLVRQKVESKLMEDSGGAPGAAGLAAAVPMPASPAMRGYNETRSSTAVGSEMAPPAQAPMKPMGGIAAEPALQEELGNKMKADYFALAFDVKLTEKEQSARGRSSVRAFFRSLGPTKEWAENNYHNLPITAQGAGLIPLNAFWRDFAAWNGQGAFFSQHLAEAHSNFTEIMLALAVIDLPFESAKHQTQVDDRQYSITAASAALAFHKQIRAGELAGAGAGELLVSESFFRKDDPTSHEGEEAVEKYVTDDFLVGVVYGGRIVVTNPTPANRRVQVLLQIPQGSIPAAGSRATDSKRLELAPYTTESIEYAFYFPAAADQPLPHYAARVAQDGKIAGAAKPFSFRVIAKPAKLDEKSWDYISQYGQDAEVFAYLEKNNLQRIDLERIAWRVRGSVEFFRKLVSFLAAHHVYSDVIWGYAVEHSERAALAEWLKHREEFVAELGAYLRSPLVTIDPTERGAYEHLEYSPLVNQRAHPLGGETHVRNQSVREQYERFLKILAHKPGLEPADALSITYYLFLQDRVAEGLARLETVKPEALQTRLQYDYLRAYAAFYQERLPEARAIATQYAQYPVPRWQKLFAEVLAQADEIDARQAVRGPNDQPDREALQAALAQTEPSFDFKVENRKVILNWQNLQEVTVSYYLMDPELMFSSNPFVGHDPSRFSIVKPAKAVRHALPADRNVIEIPLPQEYERANVLVEVVGAGQRKAQAYHANNLRVTVTENYGRLDVRDETTGKGLSKTYVKVYARLKNGQIRFYKDGYTDLRGRFDYASLNSSGTEGGPVVPFPRPVDGQSGGLDTQMIAPGELGEVERLSLLVLSSTHGALVREAAPPAQ